MRCPLKAGIDQHMQDCGYAECDQEGCQIWKFCHAITTMGSRIDELFKGGV